MQNRPQAGDDRERGETSKDGFSNSDDPKAPQDNRIDPELAEPAEGATNPPTHSKRDDGLGQKDTGDDAAYEPVPSGDPVRESDRTDLQ
jgi:hypothetical protein